MKDLVQDAINEQIKAELSSAYTYLAMAARMEARNLKGFGNWLRVQWEEELAHAMKLYDFVLQRGGRVSLKALPAPDAGNDSLTALFECVLEMECDNTSKIHALYDLAVKERDYPLQTVLHWFIDEQVEEEDLVGDIIEKLRLVGDSGPNLFLLDQEMAARTVESAK